MCCQVGIIFGKKKRRKAEREQLLGCFTDLLIMGGERNPHATGSAWVKKNGTHRILKAPKTARKFTRSPEYRRFLDGVDYDTTVLMGHSRWRTVGSERNNRNNHPIRTGDALGTHNGTIYNAEGLFQKLDLPRRTEVDSEIIFRVADAYTGLHGIWIEDFKKRLALMKGQISAVVVSLLGPERVCVLKGNKPLTLWRHERLRVVVYASDERFLKYALRGMSGWRPIDVPEMTMLRFDFDDIGLVKTERFKIIPQYLLGMPSAKAGA